MSIIITKPPKIRNSHQKTTNIADTPKEESQPKKPNNTKGANIKK